MSPFLTAFGRSGYATGILPLALLGLVVSVIVSSLLRCIGSEASFPTRSLGPGRSWRIATGRRRLWLTLRIVFMLDRKSTRLNSSHEWISYAVFCLKKKTTQERSL